MTPADIIRKYVRAANYLTVTQIHLLDNYLLARPLTFDDIKPRLIGHWGTCPGVNFVYANLNYLIQKYRQQVLFILGPGHGFAAIQANLFLEGTLEKFYPQATRTPEGIAYLSKNFSWPYGFQSHSNPTTPGVVLEGGELGYSLSTAYGTVLDNPDLLTVVLVGDGEAETGPMATSWHLNKFMDPTTCGTVLPMLHLNGYKISGPTIFGRMSDEELISLFYGYGYNPHIVDGDDTTIYETMIDALDICYEEIRGVKEQAKAGRRLVAPRYPMIILRTLKGWTGIKELHGEKIEGNNLAHQIVVPKAKSDPVELAALEKWMRSYNFPELYDPEHGFVPDILGLVPPEGLRIGENRHGNGGTIRTPLVLPDPASCAEEVSHPGVLGSSSMRRIGKYLTEVFRKNEAEKNFRLFSPDEIYSNKLDGVFEATARQFVWPLMSWDKNLAPTGRVIEMLSEHALTGMLEGYILSGRHGLFASYEAFVQIVGSMVDQYAKFIKVLRETPWRGEVSSLNIILTSSGWRQEHNGFSHQNPGIIGDLLEKQGGFINIYFPADGNMALVCLKHSLERTNGINVIVCGKTYEPRWLTIGEAEQEFSRGMMTWEFASDPDPDIVLVGIGDYMMKEVLATIDYVKSRIPGIRLRCVDVINVLALAASSDYGTTYHDFDGFLTADRPVIVNFHGNPETLKPYILGHKLPERFSVHGYIENGSLTTPFDMQVRNNTSRYQLAIEIVSLALAQGKIDRKRAEAEIAACRTILSDHRGYIKEHGVDPPEIANWVWKKSSSS
ncbi:phosphoketolase family protein [Patescibacteria group bacterium]|nr:phosphoketolase family protein [Patescibacteria group bacterium]